nr:reverse transcriptase domain-containing protein [Tanacetum cinerariifolium]
MLPVAPPSPDYIPGPEEPQTPPAPQDKGEHKPMFIQPYDLDFVPEPIYPEYIPLEDEHILSAKEQPLPPVVSPTDESPRYVAESDLEEDPEEYEDDETEDAALPSPSLLHMPPPVDRMDDIPRLRCHLAKDDADDEDENEEDEEKKEEEEEQLTPADFAVVIPTDKLVSLPDGTEPVIPPPSTDTATTGARITRFFLSTLGSRYEVGESFTARPIGGQGIDYGFVSILDAEARRRGIGEIRYGIKDTWIDLAETVPEIAPMTMGEASGTDDRDSLSDEGHETRDGRHAGQVVSTAQIMAPVTRQGPSTLPNNTNLNNMTPESVQAMIDQALLRNSTNGDGSHISHKDNRRNVQAARPCFYADFMKCQPLNFKGTEGVVGLTRWIEKMESVFQISGCAVENQVKENNVSAYTERFQELTLICTKFVADENEKLTSANFTPMQQSNNKRKADESFRNNHGHQQQIPKRQNVARDYNMGTGERKPYSRNLPKSSGNANVSNEQRNNRANPKGNGCFECRATGHFRGTTQS